MEPLFIHRNLSISETDLTFTFSRSSGPGGQNVNKLNTRVTVSLNITDCDVLSDLQKHKLFQALKGRIDKTGVLHLSCQDYRSQHANRNAALQRLAEIIAKTLQPVKKRRPTKPTRAAVERRIKLKKQRSQQKKQRSETNFD